jgi:hypothetical protein
MQRVGLGMRLAPLPVNACALAIVLTVALLDVIPSR